MKPKGVTKRQLRLWEKLLQAAVSNAIDTMLASLRTLRRKLWSFEDRTNLRQQVSVATAILCFVIVGTLALVAASVGRDEALRVARATLDEIAQTFANRIDRNVAARVGTMQHVATLEPLQPLWLGDLPPLRKLLAQTMEAFPGTEWMGFATPDGIVRAGAGGAFEGHSVAHYAWFKQGSLRSTVVTGKDILQPLAHTPPDFTMSRFADIGVPVRGNHGQLLGVLGVYMSRDWVRDLRGSTIGGIDRSRGLDIDVLDVHGVSIFDTAGPAVGPDARASMIAAGHGVLSRPDTGDDLVAFGATSDARSRARWLVIASQARADAISGSNRVVQIILALGCILALAGVLGAMMIAARVSRPFQTLAEDVADIGPQSIKMPPRVRGSREARQLSSALRALVLRLTSAERHTAAATIRVADVERRMSADLARLRNIADTDDLTELNNRRAFLEVAQQTMDTLRSSGRAFAILMIDIDDFKRINDTYGHGVGDTVIRGIALMLRSALRPSDVAGRFGGEEFVALIADVSENEAVAAAERIRDRAAQMRLMTSAGHIGVTVSIGVAFGGSRALRIDDMIEEADGALYIAKRSGRNRVALAAPVEARLRA